MGLPSASTTRTCSSNFSAPESTAVAGAAAPRPRTAASGEAAAATADAGLAVAAEPDPDPYSIVSVNWLAMSVAPHDVFMPSTAMLMPIMDAFIAPSTMVVDPGHLGQWTLWPTPAAGLPWTIRN